MYYTSLFRPPFNQPSSLHFKQTEIYNFLDRLGTVILPS